MRIMAYDPGMVNIGYACVDFEGGAYSHRTHGLHTVPSGMDDGDRMMAIMELFEHQIVELKPDVIVYEDNFGLKPRTLKGVGMTLGLLILACAHAKIKRVPVSPKEWKKALSGNGKCHDEGLCQHIRGSLPGIVLSEKAKAEHENDALGMCIAYPRLPPVSPKQNRAEKEMIKSFIARDEILRDAGMEW